MNQALDSTLPANIARSNFYRILEEVNGKLRQFTITLRGKQKAVIMSQEEYESWVETLEIMSDKKLMRDIRLGLKQVKAGKGIPEAKAAKLIGW